MPSQLALLPATPAWLPAYFVCALVLNFVALLLLCWLERH